MDQESQQPTENSAPKVETTPSTNELHRDLTKLVIQNFREVERYLKRLGFGKQPGKDQKAKEVVKLQMLMDTIATQLYQLKRYERDEQSGITQKTYADLATRWGLTREDLMKKDECIIRPHVFS